ncbi:hypothetical protein C8Q75DRAFT_465514 [Abortiporus biennis]|nr:hypothetical protein C8Q75DRAFT_465514 [Abortiporus biennis]
MAALSPPHEYFEPRFNRNEIWRRYKIYLAGAYAFRKRFNPHNYESSWYAFGYQFLDQIVASRRNFLVLPQEKFSIDKDGSTAGNTLEDNTEDDDVGNLSFQSIASVHEKPKLSCIPDFVVIHLESVYRGIPADQFATKGQPEFRLLQVDKHTSSVPIIIEVKAMPSRTHKGDALFSRVLLKLTKAIAQLFEQAAIIFHNNPRQQWVVLIAMVGPFWRIGWYSRDHNRIPTIDALLRDLKNKRKYREEEEEGEEANDNDGDTGDARGVRGSNDSDHQLTMDVLQLEAPSSDASQRIPIGDRV